ncbi:hypothetical protein A4A49_29545, partial [Nicotiana attenuata]
MKLCLGLEVQLFLCISISVAYFFSHSDYNEIVSYILAVTFRNVQFDPYIGLGLRIFLTIIAHLLPGFWFTLVDALRNETEVMSLSLVQPIG